MLLILAITASASDPASTAVVDVRKVLVEHFDGWGTSLCWWANVAGGYENREDYADLAFTSLGLNIVRYNIGGGENPARDNTMEFRARMPGFQPEPGVWDWSADANQRWMLRAAIARGADRVVAFSNSPPHWMTVSGSVTGSVDGTQENLRLEFEQPFAEYLATVIDRLQELDNVRFDMVTPMNEPAARWWKLGHRQEGTHMSVGQQQRVIALLRDALDERDIQATIAATDDNDERSAARSIAAYSRRTLRQVSHLTAHTYSANDSAGLRGLAKRLDKPLWVSEYGDGEPSGMRLARRIRDDIVDKRASAWIYWQFADNSGAWGLVFNALNGRDSRIQVTRKFFMMAQYSRFIRPGSRIVQVTDEGSLAAYDPARRQLVIVSVNDSDASRTVTFRTRGMATQARAVSSFRTSQDEDAAAQPPIVLEEGRFTATLPPRSVTTFIVPNAEIAR